MADVVLFNFTRFYNIVGAFFKKTIFLIISLFLAPFKFFIPKRNVVILQAYNKHIYCENTKYIYESLSKKSGIDAYWVTDNLEIKKYIKSKGWKYITKHNPVKMIWVALIAKVVVDSGHNFFNIFNLTRTKSVVKITTLHGSGPKSTLYDSNDFMESIRQIKIINRLDYINFSSKYSAKLTGKKSYFLPDSKIVVFGYPRCDHFFNEQYVEKHYQEKKVSKLLNSNISSNSTIILYTPTWRPYKYIFPLSYMPGFSIKDFNNWLRVNNLFFFYSTHSNRSSEEVPNNLDRVVFIDQDLNPLFDINELMMEVDVLLNDYSTTSTDFSLLNRPQVFYMPDYNKFDNRQSFVEEYREIIPGKEVFDYIDFKRTLINASYNSKMYVKEYLSDMVSFQEKYYDKRLCNSSEIFSEFILNISHSIEQ
jgi:CDP-ribitol ribitolphosphotransferase